MGPKADGTVKGFEIEKSRRLSTRTGLSAASVTVSLLVMHYATERPIDALNDDAQDTDSTNRPIDFATPHMPVTSADSRAHI